MARMIWAIEESPDSLFLLIFSMIEAISCDPEVISSTLEFASSMLAESSLIFWFRREMACEIAFPVWSRASLKATQSPFTSNPGLNRAVKLYLAYSRETDMASATGVRVASRVLLSFSIIFWKFPWCTDGSALNDRSPDNAASVVLSISLIMCSSASLVELMDSWMVFRFFSAFCVYSFPFIAFDAKSVFPDARLVIS
ncbi:MAG: hypothetical protein BWY45_01913 [Euryarchaeota archaeon ADurb.Bin294]|nr:MAG: hypothetical protein BWY45_01913 [Euryarchaeota archaeon ADurb.Bin294]